MARLKFILLSLSICTFLIHGSHGCQMDGVTNWILWQNENILDTFRGPIVTRSTTNIIEIINVLFNDGLNGGPYMDISLQDSIFVIETNSNYPQYEEYETLRTMSFTVQFRCTGGTQNQLTFAIEVTDTNNNDPLFMPTNEYEFLVTPPLPPGYQITNFLNEITVRDIDLTTMRIDFQILNNPDFDLSFDSALSTTPKEFKGTLTTTSFIRNIPEPLQFTISATDVDETGDPQRTTYATVRVVSDGQFEMPEEPVFTQPFYTATYTESEDIIFQAPISLQQGFHVEVQFSLEQDVNSQYFELIVSGNNLSLRVDTPIPPELLSERYLLLVVRAERQYTSGASATIVLQLPEEESLLFETPNYEGAIVDNVLQLPELVLAQGYDNQDISVQIGSDYAAFFSYALIQNRITISMSPLDSNIIDQNNILNLQVIASTGRSSASTIVTLEIVKDDNVTPIFERVLYAGYYDETQGLNLETIVITQGFDENVEINLRGDYSEYFQLEHSGPNTNLIVSGSLAELYNEGQILLTMEATKPRTVGARTMISITLPPARELRFGEENYRGTIQNNILIHDSIILSTGYEAGVIFDVNEEYRSYFEVTNDQSQVTITIRSELPENIVSENSFILLTLTASDSHAVTGYTTVLLEIIKEDDTTPIFNQNIYHGIYSTASNLEIPSISLSQGFDDTVSFFLDGALSQYFTLSTSGNNVVVVVLNPVPEQVIFEEKVLVFNIIAAKPLTVGARATISISFPTELTEPTALSFSRNTYTGTLEQNTLELENIILDFGYTTSVQFTHTGEHYQYFSINNNDNIVTLSLIGTIPSDVLDDNFITLDVRAQRDRAVPVTTTVVIEIIQPEPVVPPLFSETFYRGLYTGTTLVFQEDITLAQGFDDTVTFILDGEFSQWFTSNQDGNLVSITSDGIPDQVLGTNHHLTFAVVARKPEAADGRATVIIDLPRETLETLALRFEQSSYVSSIQDNSMEPLPIALAGVHDISIEFTETGEYVSYFTFTRESNTLIIELSQNLPNDIIESNSFITLNIEASNPEAISAYTTVIIELIKDAVIETPVFGQAYYTGQYLEQGELLFENTFQLIQGFDETVTFSLNGDDAIYFNLDEITGNSFSLSVNDNIEEVRDRNHLLFSIIATKPQSISGESAVIINLPGFSSNTFISFESINYVGSIENNAVSLSLIVLSEGYSLGVEFSLIGDLSNYFGLDVHGAVVAINLVSPIPSEAIPTNRLIVLEVQAIAPDTTPAYATVILGVIIEEDTEAPSVSVLAFEETYYVGSYTAAGGLVFDSTISLAAGYDTSVDFTLDGEGSQWFSLETDGNAVRLTLSNAIPPAALTNNQQLVFVIVAQTPSGTPARATIVISLADDLTDTEVLGFDRISYVGSIENNAVSLSPIVLSEGYSLGVEFSLIGDLSNYFGLDVQGAVVAINLVSPIPSEAIPTNRLIVLEVQAIAPDTTPAYATVILGVIIEEDTEAPSVSVLAFEETYYVGSYTAAGGLVFDSTISLAAGYDTSVDFTLDGEGSQWFSLETDGNAVRLTLSNAIPPAALTNNQQLVFVIVAQTPSGTPARATIVISLADDLTDTEVLGFDRISYVGSIENNAVSLSPIVLSEGYSLGVEFSLIGDLSNYFGLDVQGAVVAINLVSPIPSEAIPTNRLIVLEVQAIAPDTTPAYATVILGVIIEEDTEAPSVSVLAFEETYYVGSYTAAGGLVFDSTISLAAGYDTSVDFTLDGEGSQWFSLETDGNAVRLTLSNAIPPAALTNNQQLVFVIVAQTPSGTPARATIVISLADDLTDTEVLGFDRISYVGSIENNAVSLSPIVLSEGYSLGVEFSLIGDLSNYFGLDVQGAVVAINMVSPIPSEAIPTNRLIVLEVQATAPDTTPAYATVILGVIIEEDTEAPSVSVLAFEETYYVGSYTAAGGLVFDSTISLAAGYDTSVDFTLDGEGSQWFSLETDGNAVRLTLSNAIPPAALTNIQQLVFVIVAQTPSGTPARATIVISLADDLTDTEVLGFDRISYVGSIENNAVSLSPIVLSEGYSLGVEFSLIGDLSNYFGLDVQGAVVAINLVSPIPSEAIPTNRLIVLEVQAIAPDTTPAYATVILGVIIEEDTEAPSVSVLAFEETYYVGSYTAAGGLVFDSTISLAAGYDTSVDFTLDGEGSQWFSLETDGNAVRLKLSNAIPPAALTNNQQLVFVIVAQTPSGTPARATIVISLADDLTDTEVLGFDRISYVGSIENNAVSLSPIVLSEGYSLGVEFSLIGDLSNYFGLDVQGAVVAINLVSPIPSEAIPTNRLIVLEVQAIAPDTTPAYATVILGVIIEEDTEAPSVSVLAFEETYYVGSYTAAGGLVFDSTISLAAGYDTSVDFTLDGEGSQWFSLETDGNAVRLTLSNAIPPAALTNNQQLVFVIVAQTPSRTPARATIVISLADDLTDTEVLGFDRISYVGSIENNAVSLSPIVLSEGYSLGVEFSLIGDLSNYFGLDVQGAVVAINMVSPIPSEAIPTNRLIVLEVQATAPDTTPAYATVILGVIIEEDTETPSVSDLAFEETYYVGSYTAAGGLVFDSTISLAAGYDTSVDFTLDGEGSQWFSLETDGNVVRLTLSNAIPPAALTNNHQLVFVIVAQTPSGTPARATIVIALTDGSLTTPATFSQTLYEGRIQGGAVVHEPITINGAEETQVEIIGDFSTLFRSRYSNGEILIEAINEISLPADVRNVVLELRAATAGAVLILEVTGNDAPAAPTVSFSATSYVVRVEVGQTGAVGRVEATSSNGEVVIYTLRTNNEHLQSRLSVTNDGELRLSAPADSGVYNLEAVATTVFSAVEGVSTIYFSVEALSVCDDSIVTAPLIIIDRDEEEPHRNLVVLNSIAHEGCRYSLANRWPVDQTWLYVDEIGLHANAIDREDPSIAFMALSQIQVELTLHCDSDTRRTKRQIDSRYEWLGPYDYGTNTWLLGNTIDYNPRRSIVNIVVNDINDNSPIFIGKENEPIAVGYPGSDIEDSVLPRSLVELQATDADIGENAALIYWSSDPQLAVSPTTGFVHVRNEAELANDMLLTVSATDLMGQGNTGTISLIVKLLDSSNIAVLTIQDAFLEDESRILSNISSAVGYEVKVLRSAVISEPIEIEEETTNRRRRQTTGSLGGSLQMYVYGLVQREPVAVNILSTDISSNAATLPVTVASILTLEEYMEPCNNIPTNSTALLVSTIVLSVFLFILIVAFAVWYFIIRKRNENYDRFSDVNSVISQTDPPTRELKPEPSTQPRLNIEELRRSEKRLQDMLNAPIEEVTVEPNNAAVNPETVVPLSDHIASIFIQDKLKDAEESDEDEFGEQKKTRRKSVVTFNENVEKIIHVDDNEEDPKEDSTYEIYKL